MSNLEQAGNSKDEENIRTKSECRMSYLEPARDSKYEENLNVECRIARD